VNNSWIVASSKSHAFIDRLTTRLEGTLGALRGRGDFDALLGWLLGIVAGCLMARAMIALTSHSSACASRSCARRSTWRSRSSGRSSWRCSPGAARRALQAG
jgi:hypothetical protein